MINKEQLKADGYAIEYWFNVYSDGRHGFKYSSRYNCEEAAFYSDFKPLYRIHVRLK